MNTKCSKCVNVSILESSQMNLCYCVAVCRSVVFCIWVWRNTVYCILLWQNALHCISECRNAVCCNVGGLRSEHRMPISTNPPVPPGTPSTPQYPGTPRHLVCGVITTERCCYNLKKLLDVQRGSSYKNDIRDVAPLTFWLQMLLMLLLMRSCCWLSDFVATPPLSIILDILKALAFWK